MEGGGQGEPRIEGTVCGTDGRTAVAAGEMPWRVVRLSLPRGGEGRGGCLGHGMLGKVSS